MRTLYLDCAMGASGDMLTAALLALHDDREDFLRRLNVALGGLAEVSAASDKKCGIAGLHVTVTINGEVEGHEHDHDRHHDHADNEHDHSHEHEREHTHEHGHKHNTVRDIYALLDGMGQLGKARDDAKAVYALLAEAESRVHGETVEHIHFHELGSLDALADILGACMLINELAPEKIVCSPVHVGRGTVRCAHGIVPVPAPATAELLRGIPIYSGEITGELCTPTGAALIRHFATEFAPLPEMRVEAIGIGTGTKEFAAANILRAMLGESDDGATSGGKTDEVIKLSCNIDDMTSEDMAFAQEALLNAGALEAYTVPVGMKKGRVGFVLTCLCRGGDEDALVRCIFQNTSTLGIREEICRRFVLTRRGESVDTALGAVRVKRSEGYGVSRVKAEHDDLARLARETGKSIAEIRRVVEKSL